MRLIEQDLQGEFNANRFISQFILGSNFVEELAGWQQVSLGASFKLTAHPELSVEQVTEGNTSLTIIGYILDPEHPKATNLEIAKNLLENYTNQDQLIRATKYLGGRWVLVAKKADQVFLFNDALGLRQVFFTETGFREGVWAASQPGILAWLFKLKIDDDAWKFLDAHVIRTYKEYRWPGKATAFREITHLLPNRLLDLRTSETSRFWPSEPIGRLELEQGLDRTMKTLEGLTSAAFERFDPLLGMTAGLDSRVVLAASRKFKDGLRGVTVRQGSMRDSHHDLTVAAKLLAAMGIPHSIIKAFPQMTANFSKAFKENVFLAHDHYGSDAEAILKKYSRKKVVMTGSGAEVARMSFRLRADNSKGEYTAHEIAKILYMEGDEFAIRAYSQWLDEVGDAHDVHLLDLLCWENLHGNWLASTQMEFDIAWRDIFTPFNCRGLLTDLLAIDDSYRKSPDYHVFVSLIEKMWPELLSEPINPKEKSSSQRSVKQKIKNKLKRYLNKLLPDD